VRPLDTSPEIHEMQIERYRRMTGEERVLQAVAMSDDLRQFTAAGIRARHPSYTVDEVEWALRRMRLGTELLRRVWPDAPLLAP
jgi:hypothetical protein